MIEFREKMSKEYDFDLLVYTNDCTDGTDQIIHRLSAMSAAAEELVTNLDAVVEENREPLHVTADNLAALSEQATRRFEELSASLQATLGYLQQVGGNTSDLMDSHRPALDQILINLEATTRNLKQFSETLAEQPNALIRGSAPKGRPDGGS